MWDPLWGVGRIALAKVLSHLVDLMVDPFGNYLCQKLVEECDTTQLGLVVEQVSISLVPIALDAHGTRALQKLLQATEAALVPLPR